MPIVWARPLLLAAMVQAAQDKSESGRQRTAALHARALECLRVSTGTDHPNYETIATFLSMVSQFDQARGAFDGAMGAFAQAGGAGAASTTDVNLRARASRAKGKGQRRKP